MYPIRAAETPQRDRVGDDSDTRHPKSKSVDSRDLFGEAETLHIHHRGATYTLRKTRNGKLILNK